jgi:hypothetical protein
MKLSIRKEGDREAFVTYLCEQGKFDESEVFTWLAKTRQEDPVELFERLLQKWGVDVDGDAYRDEIAESKRKWGDQGKPEVWHRWNAAAEITNRCTAILLAAIRDYAWDDSLVEEAKYWLRRRQLEDSGD